MLFEYSIDANVTLPFGWRHRTNIATWNDPPATFAIEGPFADGARGTTTLPGQSPYHWILRNVEHEKSYAVEIQLDCATLAFEWSFEALPNRMTRLTQRIVLAGENAPAYEAHVRAAFEPALADGMKRVVKEMETAAG